MPKVYSHILILFMKSCSQQTEKLRELANLFNDSFLDINKKGVNLGVNSSAIMACVQVCEWRFETLKS